MVGVPWSLSAAPDQAAPSVSTTVESRLSQDVRDRLSPLQTGMSVTDQWSPTAFPNRFRHDPLAGMATLEHWAVQVARDEPQSASRVLRETLDLVHVRPSGLAGHTATVAALAEPNTLARGVQWPADLPTELRSPITFLLEAAARAQTWRQQALARWPSEVTAKDLWTNLALAKNDAQADNRISTHTLLEAVDHRALAHGLWPLTEAVEQSAKSLKNILLNGKTVSGAWHLNTPLGEVIVDTRPNNNQYQGQQPWILIDTQGQDSYAFDQIRPPGVTVLLDLAGDDRYQSAGPGRDPSSATLGLAVLLDASGNDHYDGHWLTQGAALFGGAALIDHHGDDHYSAQGQAQGFAFGGIAALLDFDGDDRYQALTQAQAAAGPSGLAVLFDQAGRDRYVLANTPLVLPSAQLKHSNASLGQGTAFGHRSQSDADGPSRAGGLALLLDAQGDDVYEAQVFAQGAGYEGGLGVLWDGSGSDQMFAAWYAMGAAAHRASGVLVAGGSGRDRYTASHATSLGAAHDQSVAIFVGGVGDDSYSLLSLGLGAAHDSSTALFLERAGDDRYQHTHALCRGFGVSVYSQAHAEPSESAPPRYNNTALFMDLGGTDHYPSTCGDPGNELRWSIGDPETGLALGQDRTDRTLPHTRAMVSGRAVHRPR